MRAHVNAKGGLKGARAKSITNEQLFRLDTDYLIPAARGHAIDKTNAKSVRARVVVEAANMPVTYDAMRIMEGRGIEILPDAYANAGGVIASSLEYRQALGGVKFTKDMTFAHIRERFDDMHEQIAARMKRRRTMVEASMDVALGRIYETMLSRSLL